MTSEKEELKKKLMREYEKGLDETLNEGYGKTESIPFLVEIVGRAVPVFMLSSFL